MNATPELAGMRHLPTRPKGKEFSEAFFFAPHIVLPGWTHRSATYPCSRLSSGLTTIPFSIKVFSNESSSHIESRPSAALPHVISGTERFPNTLLNQIWQTVLAENPTRMSISV